MLLEHLVWPAVQYAFVIMFVRCSSTGTTGVVLCPVLAVASLYTSKEESLQSRVLSKHDSQLACTLKYWQAATKRQ